MSRRARALLVDVGMWRAALREVAAARELGCAVNEAYWSLSASDWERVCRNQAAVLIGGPYEPR